MQLCSMTSMFFENRMNSDKTSVVESVKHHHALGYSYLDLNLCAMQRNQSEFNKEDWKERAFAVREEADKLGIQIVQSHLPFPTGENRMDDPEDVARLEGYMLRALEIAAIAGVKWAVVHPVHDDSHMAESFDEQIRYNQYFYRNVIALAKEKNVGLAFENVADRERFRRFGVTAEEMIALIDTMDSPLIKGCWDFGHANMTYGHLQPEAIRKMGNRLKALHFADNHGKMDDHLAPFQGNIRWEKIMKALKDIRFEGPMVVEVFQNMHLPEELKDSSMRFLTDICNYLLRLYEEA